MVSKNNTVKISKHAAPNSAMLAENVDSLMAKYKGKEDQLNSKLREICWASGAGGRASVHLSSYSRR